MSNDITKEKLLSQIEDLISYGYEPTINPSLLEYLSIDDLISIKNNLLSKKDKLSDEDKAWLEQFRKY
jgi:hypothetical protein